MIREIEHKSYVIRIEEHPRVYVARIFEDLTEPPLAHIERGPRLHGVHRVIAAAKQHIEELENNKALSRRKSLINAKHSNTRPSTSKS
jgi:hypothetical protein